LRPIRALMKKIIE